MSEESAAFKIADRDENFDVGGRLDDSVGASDASDIALITNSKKRKVLSPLTMDGCNTTNFFGEKYKEEMNNAVKETIQSLEVCLHRDREEMMQQEKKSNIEITMRKRIFKLTDDSHDFRMKEIESVQNNNVELSNFYKAESEAIEKELNEVKNELKKLLEQL